MEPYKITHPGQAYEEPHIGRRLAKKLDTHRWHVLRHAFDNEPEPETWEAVVATKTVTPNAIKKLLAKAWCARQIMWPNRQNGILVEVGGRRLLPRDAGRSADVIQSRSPTILR